MTLHRILIFEDSESDFRQLRTVLPRGKFSITHARTPEEFETFAPYSDFSIVLIDFFYDFSPVGTLLTRKVKSANNSVPVILMSSHKPGRNDVADGFRAGAADYVDKTDLITRTDEIIKRVMDQRILTEEDLFEQQYPLPISFLFREYWRAHAMPRIRLERLVELFEVTLKLVAFSLIAADDAASLRTLPEDVKQSLLRPSLGQLLRIVISLPPAENVAFQLTQITQRAEFREIGQAIVNLRNEYIGHGILQSNAVYEKVLRQHAPSMNRMLSLLKIFQEWELICAGTASFSGDMNEYSIRKFRGANPVAIAQKLKTTADIRLSSGRVYLVSKDHDHAISLFPWLQYSTCDTCETDKLFIYRLARDREIWLLDHVDGHAKRTPEGFSDVNKAIGL